MGKRHGSALRKRRMEHTRKIIMPTGYTAPIKDGIEFNEFVWNCARAFGALVMMRDDPMDAPIPEFKPSDYHDKALNEAIKSLARLQKMTVAETDKAALKEHEESYKSFERMNRESADLEDKYHAMLAQVEAWKPPTKDHEGMKQFMVEQIQQSLKFDCHTYKMPEPMRGKEWLKLKIEKAKRDIEYHAKEQTEEVKRCNDRNEWVKALSASVPMPKKLKKAA